MNRITQIAVYLLTDIHRFSASVLRLPLRTYQLTPIHAILQSVLYGYGREFLLVFPRQSGKNEAIAQLLVYLLNLYQRKGGQIVYGAVGDQVELGIQRLEDRLDNAWNTGQWRKIADPRKRCLGNACVVFLSSHPTASTRGQTAHLLLVIDEAQDQHASHIEAVFTPMRAANNASAVYIGTVRTTYDFLWQKKRQLEAAQADDHQRRVFFVYPDQVTKENPSYKAFLDRQVARHGRHHPIIASEYFLEPIDAEGGLFGPRRLVLIRGAHSRLHEPRPGFAYLATLDVAGQDEATTDAVARLANPARDYTVCTIWELHYPPPDTSPDPAGALRWSGWAPGPSYHAVDVFVDHGSRHFEDAPGRPALVHRLAAYLDDTWHVAHLVADSSGVGEGITSWLAQALGPSRVSGFSFAIPGKKAWLGCAFLSLVETARVKYWSDDADQIGSDGWWFWRQCEACQYEIPPEGRFDRDLKWSVPASATIDLAGGKREPIHDDRLLSAALIAEADRLAAAGGLVVGTTESAIVAPVDPLENLSW